MASFTSRTVQTVWAVVEHDPAYPMSNRFKLFSKHADAAAYRDQFDGTVVELEVSERVHDNADEERRRRIHTLELSLPQRPGGIVVYDAGAHLDHVAQLSELHGWWVPDQSGMNQRWYSAREFAEFLVDNGYTARPLVEVPF